MIPRYSLPEMASVWSDEARLANWLEIEVSAVEAWSEIGTIPPEDARAIRERASFTVDRVLEVEAVTRHDVAAFVQVVADSVGPEGRWVHFGMTSSDVLDTGLALQLRAAADLLLERLEVLLGIMKRLALQHRDTVMIGRSHGIHAEPTSFGHKLAVMAFELDRDRERLRRAREIVSVGAISGVVGHVRRRRPAGGTARLRQARPAAGRGQHPGDPARPPRGVRLRARHHRVHPGSDRHRDPASGAIRGPRGAGAVRRRDRRARAPCHTSGTRSCPSAFPGWRG